MEGHTIHPLVAVGSMFSGVGALTSAYGPTLFGFLLTVIGLWLQRREHARHERAMGALRGDRGNRATTPPHLRETP